MSTTATTAAVPAEAPLPLDQLLSVMKDLAHDPIGEWMRGRGYPPGEWVLVLPEAMRDMAGPFPPRYVKFSPHVAEPYVIKDLGTIGLAALDPRWYTGT